MARRTIAELLAVIQPGLRHTTACGSCGAPVGSSTATVRSAERSWPACASCDGNEALVTRMHFPASYAPHRLEGQNGQSSVIVVRGESVESWFNLDARRAATILGVPITGKSGQAVVAAVDAFPGKLVYAQTGHEPGQPALSEEPFAWCSDLLKQIYDAELHKRTATTAVLPDGLGCAMCGRREYPIAQTAREIFSKVYCEGCAKAVDEATSFGPAGRGWSALDYALSDAVGYSVVAADYGVRPASELRVTGKGPWEHVDIDTIRKDVEARIEAEAAKNRRPNVLKPRKDEA